MEIWTQVKSLLSYSILEINLGRLLVSIFVFLVIFAFRQIFLRFCLKFARKLTARTRTTFDDQIIDSVESPARFFFVVVGLWAAFEIMKLPAETHRLVTSIIRSLFVYSFFWAAYRATSLVSGLLRTIAARSETKIDDQLVHFIGKFLRLGIVVLGGMIIVREWGYDIAGLVAGLGLGGLAVALAAKDTVANIFGSITILVDRPFSVGDWIETPTVEGTIEDIQLRSTRIRTFSNALVSMPNSILVNTPITNWSRMKKRRIKYKLGVTYSTTRAQMSSCIDGLKAMLDKHPDVHPETVFVYFNDFGDSALEIFLYFFTKTTNWQEYLSVRQDINFKIMQIIEDNGMSVAFPSRSVYLESAPPASVETLDGVANPRQQRNKK